MAYDEILAEPIREILLAHPGFREQTMFGGLAFMVGVYMCCGVVGDGLMVVRASPGCRAGPRAAVMSVRWISPRDRIYHGVCLRMASGGCPEGGGLTARQLSLKRFRRKRGQTRTRRRTDHHEAT